MTPPILKPVVGPGWSDATQAYVENADEKPRPMRSGTHGRGWWFDRMAEACPGLKNLYCPRCNALLSNGQCPKCRPRPFSAVGATVLSNRISESEGEAPVVSGAARPYQGQAAGTP